MKRLYWELIFCLLESVVLFVFLPKLMWTLLSKFKIVLRSTKSICNGEVNVFLDGFVGFEFVGASGYAFMQLIGNNS